MKTDHLIIQTSAGLFDVTLTVTTVPADDVGPAHKKYHYELPGGRVSSYGVAALELTRCSKRRSNDTARQKQSVYTLPFARVIAKIFRKSHPRRHP